MPGLDTGSLKHRVELYRSEPVDDGTATVDGPFTFAGRRWARKTDVSDSERIRAKQEQQSITTRFLVRSDELTRTINGKDRLRFKGKDYEVVSTKEVTENFDGVEITATRLMDGEPA